MAGQNSHSDGPGRSGRVTDANGPAIAALAIQQRIRVVRQMHRADLPDQHMVGFPQKRGLERAFKACRSPRQHRLTALPCLPVDPVKPRQIRGGAAREDVGLGLLACVQKIDAEGSILKNGGDGLFDGQINFSVRLLFRTTEQLSF